MDEAALLKRLGITEGPIIAFNVKGGVKEFLRAHITAHGPSNIHGRGPDGRAETYQACWERIYRAKFEVKRK